MKELINILVTNTIKSLTAKGVETFASQERAVLWILLFLLEQHSGGEEIDLHCLLKIVIMS